MEPFVQDVDFTLYVGDVREVLAELPDELVDCVATSPPFYGLRDYGMEGQIGLESSLAEWVAALVGVFAECRRVLKSTGTLWVECGDSYNTGTSSSRKGSTLEGSHGYWQNPHIKHRIDAQGYKAKDLLGQPWELAFALRGDGWWLRQAIIWHKPNAMPESATDRCTTAHSYVFLLSKAARYHFDAGAIAEPAEWARWGDQTTPKYGDTEGMAGSWIKARAKEAFNAHKIRDGFRGERDVPDTPYVGQNGPLVNHGGRTTNGQKPRTDERRGFDNRLDRADGMKNARSVWTIPTRGFPEAHFATWPEALAERIILAGCPAGGTVLDPFLGSGTTALVARRLGRRSIGIELNESYAEMAARRLGQQSLLAEPA
jgi:DNA modification methylase